MRKFAIILVTAVLALLTGCATTVSSQVSIFHEWPSTMPDKTYIFERAPSQENSPEYKTYEDMLRVRLLSSGFQEVAAGATPFLKVSMQYATSLSEVQYSYPWPPRMYDPFWTVHFRHSHFLYRGFYPYPYYPEGPFIGRVPDINVYAYYLHQLQISIAELKSNKKLADIKISTEQLNSNIAAYMPYMIDSALQNFPGKNGSTTTVDIPIQH